MVVQLLKEVCFCPNSSFPMAEVSEVLDDLGAVITPTVGS